MKKPTRTLAGLRDRQRHHEGDGANTHADLMGGKLSRAEPADQQAGAAEQDDFHKP